MLRGLHKNVHSFPQSTFQYRIYRKELWYHGMPYMSAALTKTQNTKVIFLSDGFLILHQKTKLNKCWKSEYNVLIPLFIADVLNSSVFIIHKTFFLFLNEEKFKVEYDIEFVTIFTFASKIFVKCLILRSLFLSSI